MHLYQHFQWEGGCIPPFPKSWLPLLFPQVPGITIWEWQIGLMGRKRRDGFAPCGSLTWPVPRSLGGLIKHSLLDLHPHSFWSYLVWTEAWVHASHRVPRWCWCCWSGDTHSEEHWLGRLESNSRKKLILGWMSEVSSEILWHLITAISPPQAPWPSPMYVFLNRVCKYERKSG